MNTVLAALAAIAICIIVCRLLRRQPLRAQITAPARLQIDTSGRVDDVDQNMIWYEAAKPSQIAHVQSQWDKRMRALSAEGRLFMVPGGDCCTTWDDLKTWARYAERGTIRSHYLRIVHNNPRHDMDNDAIAIEFASAADLDAFMARIPQGGPVAYSYHAVLKHGTAKTAR